MVTKWHDVPDWFGVGAASEVFIHATNGCVVIDGPRRGGKTEAEDAYYFDGRAMPLAMAHVSEKALVRDGELRAARKRALADRFAGAPRQNRHQRRVAKSNKNPKGGPR